MDWNVKDFGARGDGVSPDTKVLQDTIDRCSAAGGGRVVLENGVFLTGTLTLKSGVELHLERSAVLLGSPRIEDYAQGTLCQLYRGESIMDRCLLWGEDCRDIAFTGEGVLDGNGAAFLPEKRGWFYGRPMLLRLHRCENIVLSGLTLRNPASWTTDFVRCANIRASGLHISSRANLNGDGLDFNACERVRVSDCTFDCSDDCVCLQNSEADAVCRDVSITNCSFRGQWAGIRIGLLSCGDIENVTVSDCSFRDVECSAVKIQTSEGGELRGMTFSRLKIENARRLFFLTQNRFRERIGLPEEVPASGKIRNVLFCKITGTTRIPDKEATGTPMILDALEEGGIQDIRLRSIRIEVEGGRKSSDSLKEVPFLSGERAECFRYGGQLPAYGIFARNVDSLTVEDLDVVCAVPDERKEEKR